MKKIFILLTILICCIGLCGCEQPATYDTSITIKESNKIQNKIDELESKLNGLVIEKEIVKEVEVVKEIPVKEIVETPKVIKDEWVYYTCEEWNYNIVATKMICKINLNKIIFLHKVTENYNGKTYTIYYTSTNELTDYLSQDNIKTYYVTNSRLNDKNELITGTHTGSNWEIFKYLVSANNSNINSNKQGLIEYELNGIQQKAFRLYIDICPVFANTHIYFYNLNELQELYDLHATDWKKDNSLESYLSDYNYYWVE